MFGMGTTSLEAGQPQPPVNSAAPVTRFTMSTEALIVQEVLRGILYPEACTVMDRRKEHAVQSF